MRNTLGPVFSGADKQDIAARFGVAVRTVQRWTTAAGQRRNMFPESLEGVPLDEWPGDLQDRAVWVRNVSETQISGKEPECPPEEFVERFQSVTAAEEEVRLLLEEALDEWISTVWLTVRIAKSDLAWEMVVTYDRCLYHHSVL